jgi:hypothetical protein
MPTKNAIEPGRRRRAPVRLVQWLGWQASVLLAASIIVAGTTIAVAATASNPVNDLLTGLVPLLKGGVNVPSVPLQENGEPPLTAVPPATCDSTSNPDPSPVDGRVPASDIPGAEHGGYTCNVSVVAHQGHSGGFKVWRYFDAAGHECAYYDTSLLYPLNALRLDGVSQGVAVLDMTDPAHPVQTATLTSLPMLSPHESLNLNPQRGLLAADLGNPATYPGLVSVYSIKQDCRHPVLDATGLYARWGHESGFAPDGTFFASGTAVPAVAAIDLTDPTHPKTVWDGNLSAHGMNVSSDGTRLYDADAAGHQLIILDISQITEHKPHPVVREISRLTWKGVSIPQNAIPFTEHGHPYLLEFDEYATGTYDGYSGVPGAVRIIDIADDTHPKVISNIRLQVQQPAAHRAAAGDPGAFSPVQGYAAHYCNIPTRVNPAIVACSMITSGLRVFDIQDLLHPREIAYYVAPPTARLENLLMPSDFAMSRPEFAPERREIWYTDGTSGFYVLRIDKSAWPAAATPSFTLTDTVHQLSRHTTRVAVDVTFDHEGEGPLPVPGVVVTLAGTHAVTDATGTATMTVRAARTQKRWLSAVKDGYNPVRAAVTVG